MYIISDDPEYCPVFLYKEFMRRRPAEHNTDTSRLFLQPVHKIKSDIWFGCNPIGKNSINTITKRMAEAAGLQGCLTNHSGCHTAIQTLLENGVPPTSVIQLSGHKRIESLNNYSTTSVNDQREMSRQFSAVTSNLAPAPAIATANDSADVPLLAPDEELFPVSEDVSNIDLVKILRDLQESESTVKTPDAPGLEIQQQTAPINPGYNQYTKTSLLNPTYRLT